MPTIVLVDDWDDAAPPEPAVRWDLAWRLFLPTSPADLPPHAARDVEAIAGWYWDAMGQVGGFMKPASPPVFHLLPPGLTPAAQELVIRLASCWAGEVYWSTAAAVRAGQPPTGPNLWMPPVADVNAAPAADTLGARLTERDPTRYEARFLMPVLGVGRAFMRVETVPPGHASARLHSHSAVDEYYLVLAGHATLRMSGHAVPVGPGALVGKPSGPDLTSHFVADRGEAVVILDMEVWPDRRHRTKDVVLYPDFQEVLWRGEGWGAIASSAALHDVADFRAHYSDGYRRGVDGSYEPADLPGAPAREP
jgi:uncharacterized cupin superfamily protein